VRLQFHPLSDGRRRDRAVPNAGGEEVGSSDAWSTSRGRGMAGGRSVVARGQQRAAAVARSGGGRRLGGGPDWAHGPMAIRLAQRKIKENRNGLRG
jgi:hypothetical protein